MNPGSEEVSERSDTDAPATSGVHNTEATFGARLPEPGDSRLGPAGSSDDPGSEFVVVANRLPVDKVVDADGNVTWKRSPGGLVTALEPILRKHKGAWVGWSGAAESDTEEAEVDGISIRSVPLSAEEIAEYYEGFSNATLWPLYHDVIVKP